MNRLKPEEGLNEKTLLDLILAMGDYNLVYYDCKRKVANISPLVDTKVQLQFHQIIFSMLDHSSEYRNLSTEKKELLATIMSSTIYGTTSLWTTKQDKNKMKENSASIHALLLFLMSGIKAVVS